MTELRYLGVVLPRKTGRYKLIEILIDIFSNLFKFNSAAIFRLEKVSNSNYAILKFKYGYERKTYATVRYTLR